MEEGTLSSLFNDSFFTFVNAIKEPLPRDEQSAKLQSLIARFLAITRHVNRLALFSSNEELDDIRTQDLKYLLTDFILAELHNEMPQMDGRLERLKTAITFWETHLHRLNAIKGGTGDKADFNTWTREESLSMEAARTEKISRAKRRLALESKIQMMFEKSRDGHVWGGPDEEQQRELLGALLSRSVIDSVDHLKVAAMEIPMLEMREKHQNGEVVFPEKESLPKPFIVSIKSVDELRRLYQDRVFKPPHELPSMSLDQLADYEMKLLRDRDESKKKADRQQEMKEASLTEEQKDDAKDKKERDWDDWKDDNPKGWGNRNRNVG